MVFIRVIYDRVQSIPWLAPLIQIWYKFGAMYGKNDNGSKMYSVIFGWMIMNKQDIDICTLLWNLRKMKFWTLELVFASPFYLVLLLHTERKIFFLILTLSFVIALFTHSLGMQPLRIETFYDMLLWYLYTKCNCAALVLFLICVNKS